MNVERSTVGEKKSRRPKCPKSVNLVQSRQSLTTVRQELLTTISYSNQCYGGEYVRIYDNFPGNQCYIEEYMWI